MCFIVKNPICCSLHNNSQLEVLFSLLLFSYRCVVCYPLLIAIVYETDFVSEDNFK